MKIHVPKTTPLGELVAAEFDKASLESADPREVSRMATRSLTHMLRHTRRPLPPKKTSSRARITLMDLLGWT